MKRLDVLRVPDCAKVEFEGREVVMEKRGAAFCAEGTKVAAVVEEKQVRLALEESMLPVRRVTLRWNGDIPAGRIFGDHWERGYGDLEWRGFEPRRVMPWFYLHSAGEETVGAGVCTRPNAMCWWQCDPKGVTLVCDVRCGGMGVEVADGFELCIVRAIDAVAGENAFAAAQRLMKTLCLHAKLPKAPIYGGNNWYYAYGVSCTEEILADAGRIAEWSVGLENRPFMVIDDGWEIEHGGGYNGGPWDVSNADYPDMKALADGIKAQGVRPGVWVRPLLTRKNVPDSWKLKREIPESVLKGGCVMDPTVPEVQEELAGIFRTVESWGYELIKQDFSCFDLLGRWGLNYGASLTDDGWAFADRTKTTAMAIKLAYDAMRAGVKDETLLMGCNTVPHLSAGVFELSRTGDDTSGRFWERTRRMGVNTLAFRMPQHDVFQWCDADCVGLTKNVDWEKNKQWLDVLARSGTPLFVSAAPDAVGEEQKAALIEAFRIASQPHAPAEPLDWMDTTCPAVWKTDDGVHAYDWYEETGVDMLKDI